MKPLEPQLMAYLARQLPYFAPEHVAGTRYLSWDLLARGVGSRHGLRGGGRVLEGGGGGGGGEACGGGEA